MVKHSKHKGFEHFVANYVGGLELRIAAITDTGKERKNNEDNFALAVPDYTQENPEALIVVADGMGGHEYGEIASEIVVDTYRTQFMEDGFSLLAAAQKAHREIETRNSELKSNSGSTVVALHLHGNSATFHHAGDSRLYRYANGQLEQLTNDHSLVQIFVDNGSITPEEARVHPHKNIIRNCIGAYFDEGMSTPETNGLDHPEKYLLCSDGLTDMLEDSEISDILRQDKDVDEIARMLVNAANAKGGVDNITVAVVDVVQREDVYAKLEGVEPREYLQGTLEPSMPEITLPPVPPNLEEKVTPKRDSYMQKLADRIREDYNIFRTYFTSQEFKDQLKSIKSSIEQKGIDVGDYINELSLTSRERFKNGKAFLRKMVLEAGIGISRDVVETWTELLDSLRVSPSGVSVVVEDDDDDEVTPYDLKYENVATKYFASRHGRPYLDQTAVEAIKKYVAINGKGRFKRVKPGFDFLRYTRNAEALVAPLQEIRAHSTLGDIVQQAYTLRETIERTAVTLLARECRFVAMNEEKAVLAIDYIETAKHQGLSADDAKKQIVFLLETVPQLVAARNIDVLVAEAENSKATVLTEGVVAYLRGMEALGRDNAAAEDAFQTVLRRDETYLRFVGIDMEDVYAGLGGAYYSQRKFDKLKQLFDENPRLAKMTTYKQEVIRDWYSLAQSARTKKDHADAREYYRRILSFDTQQPRAHFLIGETYYQTGRHDEAIPHYQRAIAADPTLSFAPVHLAQCYYKAKRYDDLHALFTYYESTATEENQRLLQYKKDVINDWYELAQKARIGGDIGDAKEYYRRILRFDTTQKRARDKLSALR